MHEGDLLAATVAISADVEWLEQRHQGHRWAPLRAKEMSIHDSHLSLVEDCRNEICKAS